MAIEGKIIIEVRGGMVANIVSDVALQVYLVDHDNLKHDPEEAAVEARNPGKPDKIVPAGAVDAHLEKLLSEYSDESPLSAPGE